MYLHKEDYFKDIVMDVSNRSGITDDIIEKDYYKLCWLQRNGMRYTIL